MLRPSPSAALLIVLLSACSSAQDAAPRLPGDAAHCLPGGAGYLRARLRGAIVADIDWRDTDMTCEGGLRPDGAGLRLAIAGPLKDTGQVLRFVFGIEAPPAGERDKNLATNLTLIVEGARTLYSTRGDDKCSVDELQRSPAGEGGFTRAEARGFCTGPAATIDGASRVVVERFDFATRYTTEETH
jgi:hypothetical protein